MLKRAALRTMALLAFLTAVWTLVPGQQAKAALSGDFSYMDNGDGTAAITSYMGTNTDVIIPSVLEGLTVTEIGKDAFLGRNLASVTLPDTLTSIGMRAFGSNQLTSLTIPDSVMTIGDYAFRSNSLTSLTLSNGLKSIGSYAFTVNKLTSVILPEGLEYVGNSAFYGNRLTHVTFPNSMTGIGSSAFRYNQLTSIELPDHLESIGSYAFDGNKLTNIEIPESVKSIEHYAFINNALTQVTILGNTTSIGGDAFVNNQVSPGDLTFISHDPSPAKDYAVANGHTFHKLTPELSGLTLSEGTLSPVFASDSLAYTVSVTNSVYAITVTPTASYSTFAVTVNGMTVTSATASQAIPLNVGENAITVTVATQDGTTKKSYKVTVTRAPSNSADLTNLELSDGALSPAFGIGTTSYSATVANSVYKLTVTPTAADLGATIKVNGNTTASGMPSQEILLDVGDNVIDLTVTAQDGTTTKTYTVTVTRPASSNADLNDLALSNGSFSPAFDSGVTSYTATVGNGVASVTVIPTASDLNGMLTVNGTIVSSGGSSASIPLNVGVNEISVTVTAEDGTTKTYTITVTRATSNSADLTNLVLSDGVLSPAFGVGTTSYAATVANSVYSLTVTPTTADPNATITVNGNATASGAASQAIPLNAGENAIDVTVTAQDGQTTKTYTVIVTRNSADSTPAEDGDPDSGGGGGGGGISTPTAPVNPPTPPVGKPDTEKPSEQPGGAACSQLTWADVQNHWAKSDIELASELCIVNGHSNDKFMPDDEVTRLQFALMVARAKKLPAAGGTVGLDTFKDRESVPAWADAELSAAIQAGIIEGYEDGMLRPNEKINRAEMVTMLIRGWGMPASNGGTSFADDADIPDWAKGYVAKAAQTQIIEGRSNNRFEPSSTATRAEAVVVLVRILQDQP